ncbi:MULTISPECIES: SEC10/PgrA surface exclusion domain-containing protein [unclassified Streptococcus]|uniref:SEC10/PgrA surface exclusion domain-containing protein n=1 Tax=unclassified Streptococcus TaxID=2608887 RepID=UPI00352D6D18
MKKKTIKATVSAVSIATAFAGISVVQADEVTATQPNESTLSVESTTLSSTNIKQVDGVFVNNGVATVTKTPTSEVVEEARTIKEETDQSVSNQESALENAKASEATATSKVSEANVDLKNAEANKESATPEKIEKTKNEISEVKADIEKKETSLKDASDKVLEAEKERNQQSEVIKKDQDKISEQEKKVSTAEEAVATAQKNLDGTGASEIIAERDKAKSDVAEKESAESAAKKALENAISEDRNKAEELSKASSDEKTQLSASQVSAKQLADAKKVAEEATNTLVKAQKEKETAQKVLDGTGVEEIVAERDAAKENLDAKTATENTAKQELDRAKEADAKKATALKNAKSVEADQIKKSQETAANLSSAEEKQKQAQENLKKAQENKVSAQSNLDASESQLAQTIANRDSKANELANKQNSKISAEEELKTAKENDAKKASEILALTTKKNQEDAKVNETSNELSSATSAAQEAKENKEKAAKAVETLNKQIAAIKNLTIPQLPQDVIDAYKAYLADDTDANKNALNDVIQKWFTGSQYDFGTPETEYSPEHQNIVIKGWPNKDIVLPIDDSEVDLDNLTDKQIEALSQYYALLANNLQDLVWGSHHYIVTEESVQGIKNIAKAYADENKPYGSGHSDSALAKDGLESIAWAGENMSFNNTLLGYGGYYSEAKETRKATMSQLYREVYDAVISFITNDVHAYFGHMKLMIGEKAPTKTCAVGAANSFTANGVGRMHFIKFKGQDAHLEYVKDEQTGEYHFVNVDDYYDKGIAKPLATPFDTSKMEDELTAAKTKQTAANTANDSAQKRLEKAKSENDSSTKALKETTAKLDALNATPDQTPAATTKLGIATQNYNEAQTQFNKAQDALDQLNADIQSKRQALANAKDNLDQATTAEVKAKSDLEKAKLENQNANQNLKQTQKLVAELMSVPDQTPSAQKKYDNAKQLKEEAETRYIKAQTALDNLNADLQVKQKALETAKEQLEKAKATDKTARNNLDEATKIHEKHLAALNATRQTIARLNSISDKTPLAQKNLDEASQQLIAAKTRYTKAQSAVENLNADIQTKQKVLAEARAELDKELKVLSELKAEKARDEAELRNRQNKVEELKAKESQIKDAMSKLKTNLVALETLLDHFENADAYLKKAKDAYDNAVEEHRLALENVVREEAKLKTLLQDQLDATAQYEAVREAYLNTRTRQSEVFNDKVDHKMISLNPTLEKSIPENTFNERVYSYAGNQAKYAANRALPNTSSIENWLVFAMGIVLCSFGISVSRKHRN